MVNPRILYEFIEAWDEFDNIDWVEMDEAIVDEFLKKYLGDVE